MAGRRRRNRSSKEIRKYQKSIDLLLRNRRADTTAGLWPKQPFRRFVRELLQEMAGPNETPLRVQRKAMLILQEAGESYLVNRFQDANTAALHAKRITLMKRD